MRIERIEVRVTDLKTRLQRQRSTGPYDTGAPGALLGKPVLVTIFAEGVIGRGQIRPLAPHHAMPDTYATMISMIREVWGPGLIGQRIFDVETIHGLFDSLAPANYMARAALDAALYDAMGKLVDQPVYNLIGGLAQPRIPLEWSISMAFDPKKMVADAERALHEFGIRVLCIKSGHPDGWRQDAIHFRLIREAVGEEVVIGMDPNTGWTVPETLQALEALREHRVDYLEQPVKRTDLAGMAAIRRAATGVPLMADEACQSIQDAHAIIALEAADVLCIKLYKHGGITPAQDCRDRGSGQRQGQLRRACRVVSARGSGRRPLLRQPSGGACHAGRRIHLRSGCHGAGSVGPRNRFRREGWPCGATERSRSRHHHRRGCARCAHIAERNRSVMDAKHESGGVTTALATWASELTLAAL
jgi:L-alanine-DL-glutamate epimerase-like enolase superfamily enzyme